MPPEIRATLPPAIHTDRMRKRVSEGWAKFDARAELALLERSLTPTLEQYAADERHLALIVEQCRKTIAEFLRQWLLREHQWGSEGMHSVEVIFPHEKEAVAAISLPSADSQQSRN